MWSKISYIIAVAPNSSGLELNRRKVGNCSINGHEITACWASRRTVYSHYSFGSKVTVQQSVVGSRYNGTDCPRPFVHFLLLRNQNCRVHQGVLSDVYGCHRVKYQQVTCSAISYYAVCDKMPIHSECTLLCLCLCVERKRSQLNSCYVFSTDGWLSDRIYTDRPPSLSVLHTCPLRSWQHLTCITNDTFQPCAVRSSGIRETYTCHMMTFIVRWCFAVAAIRFSYYQYSTDSSSQWFSGGVSWR